MPKQQFLLQNPYLTALNGQEATKHLEQVICFSALLLHQQHYQWPMHIVPRQVWSSSLTDIGRLRLLIGGQPSNHSWELCILEINGNGNEHYLHLTNK